MRIYYVKESKIIMTKWYKICFSFLKIYTYDITSLWTKQILNLKNTEI